MATQTQAQVRQSQIDQLDNIGQSAQAYDQADVFTAAERDVAAFIERVQANINSSGMILSGNIADLSLKITGESIEVLGNDYLLYQDKGVKGSKSSAKAPNSPYSYRDKRPPLQVFIDYVTEKNLTLRNQAQFFEGESPFKDISKEDEIRTLAVLIQKKVFEEGFKPRNVFAKEIPQLKEDLKKSIKNFGKEAIKEVFNFKR